MIIKTESKSLVNFDHITETYITATATPTKYQLVAFISPTTDNIEIFSGTITQVEIALTDIEDAYIKGAKMIDFSEHKGESNNE